MLASNSIILKTLFGPKINTHIYWPDAACGCASNLQTLVEVVYLKVWDLSPPPTHLAW